jgi:hypothetical protein
MRERKEEMIGILFPIIGAMILLLAIFSTVYTFLFINIASRAEGKVVRLAAGGAHPVIQFMSDEKRSVEFSESGLVYYAVGDKVTVLYLKKDLQNNIFEPTIDTPGALWFTPFFLTFMGGIFLALGLFVKSISSKSY